jgi:hypothetical protein
MLELKLKSPKPTDNRNDAASNYSHLVTTTNIFKPQ